MRMLGHRCRCPSLIRNQKESVRDVGRGGDGDECERMLKWEKNQLTGSRHRNQDSQDEMKR